jgi:hypothetical protein
MIKLDEKKYYTTLMNSLLISTFFCGAAVVQLATGVLDYVVGGVAMLGPFVIWFIGRKKKVVA